MTYNTFPAEPNGDFFKKIRKSFTAKVIMIGLVVLLCQIPILMVDGLISKRQDLADNVEREIASKWGYKYRNGCIWLLF